MVTDHATRPTAVRGPGLPASLTPALLGRLTARASAAPDAARVTTTSPYTGVPLADLPVSTPEDVEVTFARARVAQKSWAATPIAERKRILLRYHDLVLARQDEALDLMQAENGKTRRDAFLEVVDIGIVSRYYARNAAKYLGPKRRRGAIPLLTHTTELRHPKGVVAVVSPWNYPLSMAASDTIAALMAGNAVVQKPDTQTALTALWSMDLMYEAGLPAGVWQMVIGRGSSIGGALMDNADYMMFTGSTATGRQIASDAGRRLIGASLELGGKNAMIVLDDADIEKAAEGAVNACFPSAGQLCVSIERLYVAESIRDAFVAAFVARTKKLKIGAAYDYSVDVGSLTTPSQLKTVTEHVDDAVSKGATVLAGGRTRPDLGPLFYEPTILTDVTPDMTLHDHETFGPVVSVYGYRDVDEAVARANATPYGLNASVWSRDGARARAVAARVHAGTVNVNEGFAAAWGSVDSPMGGMGDSGLGRRHGADGILKYTEPQTVAHQRLQGFYPPARVTPETWATLLTGALKVMKAAGMR
ncbi:succinic semialdehyde dehydrogenase [Streptomyces sp. Amel2xC10]|uniref:succinic semialdehyde dehydrogenase n=1 Tax=Streptomyces sp. Amel2xC10 TaxID=1305826 RepID=UPI000A086CF8|nr:succinic semialdehyde dehydrogenase [Streptomyces sp. Amel2xC10]SMF79154.1 succinate-semialdehyde dehydrogenase / glutarate-semialdehyde dehydrogenase [Streptomyces sp. Amel2xC10]